MRNCLAKSFLLKITHAIRTRLFFTVLSYSKLPSLRHEACHSKFYGGIVSLVLFFFIFFFWREKEKVTANPPGNASTFCRRLISWLNIIGEKRTGGLCLSFSLILIGPSVLLYDPPQLATARSSAAAWCPANDRNPIFHCHRPSTFSRNEISGLPRERENDILVLKV